jgi:hypothetical protein
MFKVLTIAGAVLGFLPSVPTLAGAQAEGSLTLADSRIDGRSSTIIPGHANGHATTSMTRSAARDLGPAAIACRKTGKLHFARIPSAQESYASDRDEMPNTAQSARDWREWQDYLRYY